MVLSTISMLFQGQFHDKQFGVLALLAANFSLIFITFNK